MLLVNQNKSLKSGTPWKKLVMNQEKFTTVYLPSPEQSVEQKRVVVPKELSYYFLLILKQKGYLLICSDPWYEKNLPKPWLMENL